jgi:cobalamin biosynthetic protein CobC
MVSRPHHGGRLNEAIERWGIPHEQWLDLSTGINPLGWPVPAVPADVWHRLPEPDDGLEAIIRGWAGAPHLSACVPVAGSQAAIMTLPGLRKPCRVGVPLPGYREHAHWWQAHGHSVRGIPVHQMASGDDDWLDSLWLDSPWLDSLDVLVCINPNNPVGQTIPRERLLRWHQRLAERGGWLVVDEAFLDGLAVREGEENMSMAPYTGQPGLVVMRSLGKFFGLAGLRAGAVLTCSDIAVPLAEASGPWPLSGPARFLMMKALSDVAWQARAAVQLQQHSQRLHRLLLDAGFPASSGTTLFRYVPIANAHAIADDLASKGILVRVFDQPPALRFGLPGAEPQWLKLERTLAQRANVVDR